MIKNYFLLFQGTTQTFSETLSLKTQNRDIFLEVSALLLATNRDNFEKLLPLNNFHTFITMLSEEKITKLQSLHKIQYTLIKEHFSSASKEQVASLHTIFEYLQSEGIITKQALKKLLSIFDHQVVQERDVRVIHSDEVQDFNKQKSYLQLTINELKEYCKEDQKLESINNYLEKQKFSIGITGVMNAGKSTMLNALMGREVLGTNVIPETANLSVVKYSKEPYAKVIYWSSAEFKRIENSAKSSEAMQEFVEEIHNKFGEKLEHYIQEKSLEENIHIEKLSEYTSASSTSSVYQLVKSVEIGSDLSFLQNSIEIVDTPGLDDIVVQREAITKEYVSECDLMIHLMNVAQSATLKDVSFIVDSLLYQNISKVLIVITRADSVSKKELDEVLSYTKKSLRDYMESLGIADKLEHILESMHFITLSGKMALLHRIGRADEALKSGYALEDTGILELESYLHKTLFSQESERSSAIIKTAKKNLLHFVEQEIASYTLELRMLSKDEGELQTALRDLQFKKEKELEVMQRFSTQVSASEEELQVFITSELEVIKSDVKRVYQLLQERVMSEAKFSFEKEKKSPELKRIKKIVEDTLRHTLLDIVRDFRYRFLKQSSKVVEALKAQNEELIAEDFSVEALFESAFSKNILSENYDVLPLKLTSLFQGASLSKLPSLMSEVESTIKEVLFDLDEIVQKKSEDLSSSLLQEFFQLLKLPLKELEEKFANEEKLIVEHIEKIKSDASSRESLALEISQKIKRIELIAGRCQ